LIEFQILYDGVPQTVTADPSSQGESHIPEPNENQVVSITFRSLVQERIGLVIVVNGVNTLYEEPLHGDVAKNVPWVLDPGITYLIKGYQQDKQTYKPFRVLSPEDSEAIAYNENSGTIQFHVVKSGGADGSKQIAGGDGSTNGPPDG